MVGDALVEQPGDAMGDHPGLAAAGPGQDQQRSFDVQHGLALGLGQALQEFLQNRLLGGTAVACRGDFSRPY